MGLHKTGFSRYQSRKIISSVILSHLILPIFVRKKQREWPLTRTFILYEESNLLRKRSLHSFWLLCLLSFSRKQPTKGNVPRRFTNTIVRGMVLTLEERQGYLKWWGKHGPEFVRLLEGDVYLLQNHLYWWGDATPAANFSSSVLSSYKDLRIVALPVGPMTNKERHLKGITEKEIQIVRKEECSVTLHGSALGNL